MAGKYRAYSEYKDSGVEWLGKIPANWKIMQIKRTVDGCVNGIWGAEPQKDGKDTIVLRVADFDRPKLSLQDDGYTYRKIEESEKLKRKLKYGDLLLEKSGGGEKTLVGQVVLFNKSFEAVTSNFVAKMTPNQGFNSRFLNYVFSRFYNENINYCSIKQNTGIQNLDSAAYLSEKFGFPNEIEQQQIADFLDHETAKIDTLIDKQQQLITLLKEKRQAVISHAVTKGLNPDAPMRDSGVEWLGEVPAHWEVLQLRRITTLQQGLQIPQENRFYEEGNGRMEYITIKSINAGETLTHKEYIYSPSKRVICRKDDVLLARTGATGQVVTNITGVFHNNFFKVNYDKNKIIKDYLVYFLRVREVKCHLLMLAGTTTIPDLNHGAFLGTSVCLPSKLEQNNICEFLDKTLKIFDQTIKRTEQFIVLMQERRTALISAAVTGKIDVVIKGVM